MESYSADSLQHERKLMISSVVISFSYTGKYVTYFMVQDAPWSLDSCPAGEGKEPEYSLHMHNSLSVQPIRSKLFPIHNILDSIRSYEFYT